jgi:acylphosphatase
VAVEAASGVTVPTVRLEATVRGRVQGVGYRYHVLGLARNLRLGGWVANAPDGSVEVVAEGAADAIDRLEDALRDGPPGAAVERVDAVRMPGAGTFEGFSIRSGAHRGD